MNVKFIYALYYVYGRISNVWVYEVLNVALFHLTAKLNNVESNEKIVRNLFLVWTKSH